MSKLKKPEAVLAVHSIINFTPNYPHAELAEAQRIDRINLLRSLRLCVRYFWVNSLLVFFLLLSCASSPRVSTPVDESGLSLLPAGARVYLWADTVRARPLLNLLSFQGVNGKDAAQVLDKTKSVAVAFFSDNKDGDMTNNRQFFIAAMGNYPQFSASLSFVFSKKWKKQKSSAGGSYWHSQADNVALALGSSLALVSNTDPLAVFPAASAPDGFAEFNRGFALAGWMNDSAEAINVFMASMGIPLQLPAEDFFFGVKNQAELWDLIFKIKTPSPAQARSLLSLFSIARLFVLRAPDAGGGAAGESMSPQQAAALLFANAPELDGAYLTLRIDSLEADKIALLFNMFTIYSN